MATLDDVLEAENFQWLNWHLPKCFDLAAFEAFGRKHLPPAQEQLSAVLNITDRDERIKKLGEVRPYLERVFLVMNQASNRVGDRYNREMKALEEEQIKALPAYSAELWIETADSLYTAELSMRLLQEVVRNLKKEAAGQDKIQAVLEAIAKRPKLRQLTNYAPHFWRPLRYMLRLEGNVTGETIDIAPAKEFTVQAGWHLFDGRRVGRIIPGRAALALSEEDGRMTYIGANRTLKFDVYRAGGRLERLGNTFILGDSGQARLHQALLEVEEINALANVDPAAAVQRVAHLELPEEHDVYQAARQVERDPRYGRILADLLIELVVGIDADVARRLMRAQSRARRR